MNQDQLIALILKNAEVINTLYAAVQRSFLHKNESSQAWRDATFAFNSSYDQLAFPGGLEKGLKLLLLTLPLPISSQTPIITTRGTQNTK
jgi:hypothetical protein